MVYSNIPLHCFRICESVVFKASITSVTPLQCCMKAHYDDTGNWRLSSWYTRTGGNRLKIRRQGGTNEAARFEEFASRVLLSYHHYSMPNSLVIVVLIKRLPSSFGEFAGLIVQKPRIVRVCPFRCDVYHAPILIRCKLYRNRWAQRGLRWQKSLEVSRRLVTIWRR